MKAKLVKESLNELNLFKNKEKEEKFYLDFDFNQEMFNKYTPKQKHLFGEVLYLVKKDQRIKNLDVMAIAKNFSQITGKNLWDRLASFAPEGNYDPKTDYLAKRIIEILTKKYGEL